ncbi:MAG: hypothetical protein ABWY07_03970 [Burkholderiales bacterium]
MTAASHRRPLLVLCGLLAVLTASPTGSAAELPSPVKRTEIAEPRPFGYVIGDTLTRRVVLEADRSATLDVEHLPRPGRVSSWLELVRADHRSIGAGAAERHEITLTYQLFNSAPEVRTLALPALRIPFKTAAGAVAHEVPGFYFTAGPLTPDFVMARDGLQEMQPDAPPPPFSTVAVRTRLALYSAGLTAIALYFVYSYLGLPFLSRSRGPFARALRAVNAAARKGDERQGLPAALKAVHRAFDETAGATVFGEQLDRFFATHSRYAQLRPAVEQFFASSRKAFFGNGPADISLPWLAALCRDLRDRERGVA